MSKLQAPFTALKIAVLTVSDSRTLAEDSTGQYLVDQRTATGHQLADRQLITDDIYKIRAVVSGWIADPNVHTVITTGGTGFYIRDSIPEAGSVLFDKSVDGFGELFRLISNDDIGMLYLNHF